jgi:hypothetical protein
MVADSTRRAPGGPAGPSAFGAPGRRRASIVGVSAAAPSEPEDRRRNLRRLGVLAVVASFVGIWGYVLFLTFFEGRAEPRDRLGDRRFAAAAEETCAESTAAFERLPFASEVDSPEERADLLDEGTDELERMVTRLEGLVPPRDADEAVAVERWLDDYRTFVQDRREYADAQRDPSSDRYDRPFAVTDRGGFQIDVLLDDFALVNDMDSCETPDDVG